MPEYRSERIRELIEGDFRILYEVFPDRVEVVGVAHGSRDLMPED